MTGSWTFEITTARGWLEVPSLPEPARPEWVEHRLGQIRDGWDPDRWDAATEALARGALEGALAERSPDDQLVFQAWTVQSPIAPTVSLRTARPDAMPDWSALGYRVLPYDAAVELGPGIECTLSRELELPDGERATFAHAVHVFDVRDALVVVEVEPAPVAILAGIGPGLASALGSLAVTRPDGSRATATMPRIPAYEDDAYWRREQPEEGAQDA